MDAREFFPSKWLKAEDIGDKRIVAEIEGVSSQTFGGDGEETQRKLILKLRELEKGIVLNRTNAEKLIEEFGEQTDNWIGKVIEIYTALVSYKKKEVPAIRIRIHK